MLLSPPELPPLPVGALAAFGLYAGCNLLGLGLLQLKGRWGRRLAVAGLALLLHGTWSFKLDAMASALGDWWTGDATWSGAPDAENPDPASRLRRRSPWGVMSCLTPAGWYSTYDDTVGLLVTLLGHGPEAYDGPYPSRAEALAHIEQHGEPWSWGQGAELRVGGASFSLLRDRPSPVELAEALQRIEALRENWGGRLPMLDAPMDVVLDPLDLERGLLLRAAPLREDALLIETATHVELRLWDQPGLPGRVWARWPR
ncbi:MAG: hypothetical protein H6741_12950 [Alphaproteobacteria bacterium]|nr:hypothetical protein [Alphaproteobacteria bacterium]